MTEIPATSIKHLECIDPERKLEASWCTRQCSRDAPPKRIADTLTKARELVKGRRGAQTIKLSLAIIALLPSLVLAQPLPPNGTCPWGWTRSGEYCLRHGR